MTNYVKNLAKIGLALGLGKVAAATNGDEELLSDQNVNNGALGYVAGVYAVPKIKNSLDGLVTSTLNGERPDLKRIAKYAAFGIVGAGLGYAIENGLHKKIADNASEAYNGLKPKSK